MSTDDPQVTTNDCNNAFETLPTVPVAAGRRRSLIIFSMIIAVVLIIATFVTPVFVILKNLTARQKVTTKTTITTTKPGYSKIIKFATQAVYNTGYNTLPKALAVADVNNDYRLDIIAVNQYGNNVGILPNRGQGLFSVQQFFSTGPNSQPQSVSVVDINGDDNPDIIVANSGGHNVGTLFNYGNGFFHSLTTYPTGNESYPTGVTVADVNNDSKLDIIVTNQNKSNIGVLFNLGNGTFTSQTSYSLGHSIAPTSPVIVDINDDNYPDIIFADYGCSSIGILFNFGNGTFHSFTNYSTGFDSKPNFVSVVDINEDDKLDIIATNSNEGSVSILLNSGNGTFLPKKIYSTRNSSSPSCVSVVDLNGDNKPEIIVANSNHSKIDIFVNHGNGAFVLDKSYLTGAYSRPKFVLVVDLSDDTKPDIIIANHQIGTEFGFVGVMLAI